MPLIVKTRIETAKAANRDRVNQEKTVKNYGLEPEFVYISPSNEAEFRQHEEDIAKEAQEKMAEKSKARKGGK